MEGKIEGLTKDLKFLKELFLTTAQSRKEKLSKEELRKLLADDDEDDDDDEENDDGPFEVGESSTSTKTK